MEKIEFISLDERDYEVKLRVNDKEKVGEAIYKEIFFDNLAPDRGTEVLVVVSGASTFVFERYFCEETNGQNYDSEFKIIKYKI